MFSYRANVIAWLKGMVLYVVHGYRWDKTIADFVRWTEQYNLWCKMLYFGQQFEKELREELDIQRQTGLDILPPPALYPRPHREFLRAIVSTQLNIGMCQVNLQTLDTAYSIAFPASTPLNIYKQRRPP